MLSDETVQQEGVKALTTVCKEGVIEKRDADFLMNNVLQILFRKADEVENAKVGCLLLMESFVKEDIFGKETCQGFLNE